jgi:hypothetical protein
VTEAELRKRDLLYQETRIKIETELCFHQTRELSPQWAISLCNDEKKYIATVTERWAFTGGYRILFADGKQIECKNRVEVTDKLVDYVINDGPRKEAPP